MEDEIPYQQKKMKMEMEEKGMLFENETPHFFKVFLDYHPRLGIPRKFARMHGGSLSDSVCLKVPRGDVWEVQLERKDGEICLREGWPEFVKHYGISHGYFLVFRYKGGWRFRVIIFDLTACEIDYPVKPNGQRKSCPAAKPPLLTPKSEEEIEPGIEQEARPFAIGAKKMKEVPSRHSPRPTNINRRGPRAISAGKASRSLTKRVLPSDEGMPSGVKRKRGKFDGHLNSNYLKISSESGKAAGTSGALARACSYQCERPSFVIIVGSSSFHPKHYLCLPTKFIKLGILKQGVAGCMTLVVYDRKTWTVRYHNASRCIVSRGWKQFVSDNYLRAGDVLVDINSARDECSPRQRPTLSEVSEDNSSFEAVISQRHTKRGSLYVPVHFARALAQGSQTVNNMATLKVGQMSWAVHLRTHALCTGALRMGGGWIQFAKENGLRVGDDCLFKLIDKEHLVIEVSVVRKKRWTPITDQTTA